MITACGSMGNSASGEASSSDTASTSSQVVTRAAFDGQAALDLARQQCDFGPRVPATPAHAKCAEWLTSTLKASCDTVIVQQGNVTTGQGKKLGIKNIIGSSILMHPNACCCLPIGTRAPGLTMIQTPLTTQNP